MSFTLDQPVGQLVSLCEWSVAGWFIVYQDCNYLYPWQYSQTISWSQIRWYPHWSGKIVIARPNTFLESRSWWGHDCGKFIENIYLHEYVHCTYLWISQTLYFKRIICQSNLARQRWLRQKFREDTQIS